jgi:hypothetical protein
MRFQVSGERHQRSRKECDSFASSGNMRVRAYTCICACVRACTCVCVFESAFGCGDTFTVTNAQQRYIACSARDFPTASSPGSGCSGLNSKTRAFLHEWLVVEASAWPSGAQTLE